MSAIPVQELVAPERFMKELWVTTKFTQLRLEALKYKCYFETEYLEVGTNLERIGQAFQAILQSVSFQQIIRTILRIGNFLNSGTNKGNVNVSFSQGINLDSLRQLENFQSLDKKSTLLQFIISTALERDKSGLMFIQEFDMCDSAAKTDLSDAELKIKEFDTGLTKVMESLKKMEQIRDSELTLFKEYMQSFIMGAGIKIQEMKELAGRVKTDGVKIAVLYAENKEGKSSDLIKKFSDFATACKRARECMLGRKLSIEQGKKELAHRRESGERPKTESVGQKPVHREQKTRLSVRKRKEGLVSL